MNFETPPRPETPRIEIQAVYDYRYDPHRPEDEREYGVNVWNRDTEERAARIAQCSSMEEAQEVASRVKELVERFGGDWGQIKAELRTDDSIDKTTTEISPYVWPGEKKADISE